MIKKFYIHTLGCKVNICDSNSISNFLLSCELELSPAENADIIIVNSCAVTSESVRKVRQNINKFKKINKKCVIILTGCASILKQFSENKNVDFIFNKNNIIYELKNKFNLSVKLNNINKKFLQDRTRAFIKIEDGCQNFCSYCIIPFARGKIKSKSLDEIDFECKNLSLSGFKEVVLTGINLGKYGYDLNLSLMDAIKVICKYFDRIRLSSLEPDIIDRTFIDSLSCFKQICPHFHLSLQSGSNRILTLMNRKYDIDFYINLINNIKRKFPSCTFATDLIVGFPGETDQDFEYSMDVIKKCEFIKVNVFPFSPRPFTVAANLKQVDNELKKRRTKFAIEFSNSIAKNKISKFLGQSFDVLFESKEGENTYSGYSKNYIKVKHNFKEDIRGQTKRVIFLPDLS